MPSEACLAPRYDPQKLALLQATEPDLVATLLEIDRSKKALRGHSCAFCASNCRLLAPLGSEWTMSQSPGYQSAALALLITPMRLASTQSPGSTGLRRTRSAATRTMRVEESPPNLQRTKSAATPRPKPLKALKQSSVQTLLSLKQKEQRSEMQIFLDRRAALWPACSRPAAKAKSSKSPLCEQVPMPKSSHRRHHVCVADIEVSRSDSLRLIEDEIIVPSQTWKQSLCHFFGSTGR